MNTNTRRRFLQTASGAAIAGGLLQSTSGANGKSEAPLKVSVLSKHLQWLVWEAMAETVKEIGFDGVDLTLRKGGHVEPERAEQDLPKAAEAIRKAGLAIPMVTAGIIDATTPHAESMLHAMKAVGVKHYRWGG